MGRRGTCIFVFHRPHWGLLLQDRSPFSTLTVSHNLAARTAAADTEPWDEAHIITKLDRYAEEACVFFHSESSTTQGMKRDGGI